MPLRLYPNVYASGVVPQGWTPSRSATLKYRSETVQSFGNYGDFEPAGGKRSSNREVSANCITLNMNPGASLASNFISGR